MRMNYREEKEFWQGLGQTNRGGVGRNSHTEEEEERANCFVKWKISFVGEYIYFGNY